ncbi:MAG: cell division protein FtsL [Candidatus Marinimicrobia bacterium]|jgi:cell division protein FtsL|nr:hypothetical protein [Candidatus Neomarinimicrobiota bacterium]MDP6396942.1 cell division protein FtsL [Candidatus Neomarinimicrobiota bacterium]MDP6568285.1 cell division protein FtsL [Candidatus Neomarinimicrobiota bacterium]MDP7558056.1 cell division protein FtsL [Candidatus Neomarinimicrobiota bacterium]|tara:strand:- start:2186 stop:2542 length:357 start_codon:yes stop_codon:yes gene_type:complete
MTRLKRKRKRKTRKNQQDFINSLLFFVISVLFISGFLTYLWIYNEINLTVRDIVKLEQIHENLLTENRELDNTNAALSRSDRIASVARDKLGMISPEPETLVVYVNPDILAKLDVPND